MSKKRLGFTDEQLKKIRITIGKNLASARKNAGMSQADVMRKIWGVDNNRNRISEIENGNKDLTLGDLLIFQSVYNQSLDYICGLSVEPELDMLESTVNHVVSQSRSMIEYLTEQFAETITQNIKPICKSDHDELIEHTKMLCASLKEESNLSEKVRNDIFSMMQIVRRIESKQTVQAMAIDTQMMQIKQRLDKEDKHIMLIDLDNEYERSLPLPQPKE